MKKNFVIIMIICLILLYCTTLFSYATEKKEYVFGIGLRYLADDFFRGILLGVEERASQLGVKTIIKDAQLDPLMQLNQIDSFIEQEVDAVILVPQDPSAIIPGIEKLNKANIPVITIDTEPLGGKSLMYISFDNFAAGESAGEAMIKELENKYGKSVKGVVLEIGGDLRHAAEHQRSEGFHKIMDSYKNITVVKKQGNWIPDEAFKVTADLLVRYKNEVIGIYMHADVMGPGVCRAVEEAGCQYPQDDPRYIIVVALDGGPSGLKLLKEGKITRTVLQPGNYYGIFAIQYCVDFLEGKKLPKPGEIIEEKGALWSPARVIDSKIGSQMLLGNVIIGIDVPIDSMELWGNILAEKEK